MQMGTSRANLIVIMNPVVAYVGIVELKVRSGRAIAKYDRFDGTEIVGAAWIFVYHIILNNDVVEDISRCG